MGNSDSSNPSIGKQVKTAAAIGYAAVTSVTGAYAGHGGDAYKGAGEYQRYRDTATREWCKDDASSGSSDD